MQGRENEGAGKSKMKRKVIGLVEEIYIRIDSENGGSREVKVKAKIDTGASMSSISKRLVSRLKLQLHHRTAMVKSALGRERRTMLKLPIRMHGKHLKAFFSVADRKNLAHKMLIGQNILKLGKFVIDPLK